MSFNPAKCHTLHVTRRRTPTYHSYMLRGHSLLPVDQATYLGVILNPKLTWSPHIQHITSRANQSLGFIRRNLRFAPPSIRENAYKALVRPRLEYSSTVWAPHQHQDSAALERVQRRAARFVTGRYRNRSSVTDMMHELGWDTLEQRRLKARATMTYKACHDLIAIPVHHLQSCPTHPRLTRRTHQQHIPIRHARTDYLMFSFFYHAPVIWNSLPADWLAAPSLDSFKSRLAGVTASSRLLK